MAQTCDFRRHSHKVPRSRATQYLKILIILAALTWALSIVPSASAQLQQPLVFSSAGAVAVRNDQTGALTPVAGSPFTTANQSLAIDVQGRYLFAIGTNSVHMYQITDSTTGAYQEVACSPFASSVTDQPAYIAVEPTGQFLAVVDRVGQDPGDGLVETFAISPASTACTLGGPGLVPVAGSATELDSTAIGFAQPPDNKNFLIFMGPNPQSSNIAIMEGSEFQALSIDAQTGLIAGLQANAALSQRGDSFAMDPQGRYYVTGTQDNLLEFGIVQLLGIGGDGLAGNLQLPQYNYPNGLWIDSTGAFLYVATSDLDAPEVVNIYSVNLQTGALTETASSPLPGFTSIPAYYADPTGSFDYGFGTDQNTAIAYTVDPQTGYFLQTANSPFAVPQIAGFLSFSIPPGQQGISGPSASLSATNLSFGSIQAGASSLPQIVTLSSNGGEALDVNSVSLSGANSTQFVETDTCQTPSVLQPNKFCSINITFAPSAAASGAQQAVLSIADNAPGSPQSVTLTGAAVAPPPPAPAVTVMPDPVSFATITQGTTSNPLTVTVTNSGTATLNISSVSIGGNNVADFTTTNASCNGAIAAKAACTITVTFAPLAAGERSETITMTDNASDSPQVINVGGNANPAVTIGAAPSGSTTETVSAGQTAQFSLQITPGAGYTGVVSLSYSGAPSGAAIQGPSTLQITNGNPSPFVVSVITSGGASVPLPFSDVPRSTPFQVLRADPGLSLGVILFFLLAFRARHDSRSRPKRLTLAGAFAAAILFAMLGVIWISVGCGGGSSGITTPPQIVTPQGQSKIIVAPSATSANGMPLQLPPIPLTLNVN
ncbi:MAG TPA: choice-of-anchor D domain-containing protein [Candidatus Acidoferrum sp.]|nr:choice-of-anchor D domain-containing protein [Candidatus Acidoferrum sp.]